MVVVAPPMLQLPALRHIPPQRLHLIENGIPPLAERLEEMAARGVAALPPELLVFMAQRPTVVAIGRLSREKGLVVLLEAFARVRAARRASCSSSAKAPSVQRCSGAFGQLRLSDSVLISGYVEGADRLLEHAAGFVMSSLTEGMPLVLLEALQWQAPILATRVGAIPELLEASGVGNS